MCRKILKRNRALGILTRNQKGLQPYARELRANIRYALGEQKRFAILDMADHADTRRLELERLLDREGLEAYGSEQEEDDFGWNIPKEEESFVTTSEWDILAFNQNGLSEDECRQIREAGGVILLLPFGTDTGRKTARILSFLKNQDCQLLGMVIAQADEEFLNRYFA